MNGNTNHKLALSLFAVVTVFLATIVSLTVTPTFAQTYIGIDLYTLAVPNGFGGNFSIPGYSSMASAGTVVGSGFGSGTGGKNHALVWSGPTGTVVDLNPTNLIGLDSSDVFGTNGTQQVGYGFSNDIVAHALLWNGTANSAVDLQPTNLNGFTSTTAFGTNGTQQVGDGINGGFEHALLWNGTANSAVDLHPTNLSGFDNSFAYGTDGSQQVGSGGGGSGLGGLYHALLWSGTAGTAVDLHPTKLGGFLDSTAYATRSGQQVGDGQGELNGNSYVHALLWNGTPESAVDLNPTNINGFVFGDSHAYGTNGIQQVGIGGGVETATGDLVEHALLWSGTADSAVDLNLLLPTGFISSVAYNIDSQGDVFGSAEDSHGNTHAVEWLPVPEPATWLLLAIGCGTFYLSNSWKAFYRRSSDRRFRFQTGPATDDLQKSVE
jgi:hypothetical protein